jgi:hypothetical protein
MAKYPPLAGPLRPPSHDDASTTQLTIRIPRALHKQLKVFCVDHNTSVVQFMIDAMRHEFEARAGGPATKAGPRK